MNNPDHTMIRCLAALMGLIAAVCAGCFAFHIWAMFHGHPEFVIFAAIFLEMAVIAGVMTRAMWQAVPS